jgi:demethylmenaquinone methyltransferase/2-methoxy-6-polyprenyl-1,4-benzoquinol methylase
MTDTDIYMHWLAITNPLMEPVVRAAIQALQLPLGSRGLDAGCGIGLQAALLAKAAGPAGHVIGLDRSPEFLLYAATTAHKLGLSEQIAFRAGDVRQFPFNDNAFDWAWSSNCVGYAPLEPLPLVMELARVVRPGGSVAILAWSSETFLPGYPALEARLDATSAGIAPFVEGKKPELHFMRALGWFPRQAEGGRGQTRLATPMLR